MVMTCWSSVAVPCVITCALSVRTLPHVQSRPFVILVFNQSLYVKRGFNKIYIRLLAGIYRTARDCKCYQHFKWFVLPIWPFRMLSEYIKALYRARCNQQGQKCTATARIGSKGTLGNLTILCISVVCHINTVNLSQVTLRTKYIAGKWCSNASPMVSMQNV